MKIKILKISDEDRKKVLQVIEALTLDMMEDATKKAEEDPKMSFLLNLPMARDMFEKEGRTRTSRLATGVVKDLLEVMSNGAEHREAFIKSLEDIGHSFTFNKEERIKRWKEAEQILLTITPTVDHIKAKPQDEDIMYDVNGEWLSISTISPTPDFNEEGEKIIFTHEMENEEGDDVQRITFIMLRLALTRLAPLMEKASQR